MGALSKGDKITASTRSNITPNNYFFSCPITVLDTPNIVTLETILRPNQPPVSNIPGKGSQCGNDICNKYADCHFNFASNEFKCRCVLGFQGDGYTTCDQAASSIVFFIHLYSSTFLDFLI